MASLAGELPGAELIGNGGATVRRMVHPAEASRADDLSLLMSASAIPEPNGEPHCALVARGLFDQHPELAERFAACIVVDRPRHALAVVSQAFSRRGEIEPGVHPSAVIGEGVCLGEGCSVGAHAWIDTAAAVGAGTVIGAGVAIGAGTVIGAGCLVHAGVWIGHEVEIGDGVIIHPNAVIGSDGFAFETPTENSAEEARGGQASTGTNREPYERIESLGTVRIGDDVEIGACTTIDRSTLGATVIKSGTKIDNLVQIGHGNTVGGRVLLCAQVGVAGSSMIGDGAILAGKVGVADHRKIGANSVLMAKSGVTKDIPAGAVYYGMPAQPVKNTLRNYSLVGRLSEMRKEIRELKRAVAKLSGLREGDGADG